MKSAGTWPFSDGYQMFPILFISRDNVPHWYKMPLLSSAIQSM